MAEKFNRVWALEYGVIGGGATRLQDMRMAFKALQSPTGGNTCDVSVWMPSRELVAALAESNTTVRVLAGYVDGGRVEIAQGGVVADSLKNKTSVADPLVSFQISPNKAAMARAAVSKSWPRVHASEIIEYIRETIGVPADVIELANDVLYARGYTAEGSPHGPLTEVVKDCGSQWVIQDGRLRIWPIGGDVQLTAKLWSANTGLIESAAPNGEGKVSARSFLSPTIRPGDTVRMFDYPRWFGDIQVQECTHEGDSHGQAWFTSIEGVARGS